jgi:hypothetical protein
MIFLLLKIFHKINTDKLSQGSHLPNKDVLLRNVHHIPCKCAQKYTGHDQYITNSDGVRAGRPDIDSREERYFYVLLSVQTGPGVQPDKWVLPTFSHGSKRLESEADHSSPSTA